MKNKVIEQVQIEPNYFFNIGFPFNLKDVESDLFKCGYHLGQFASFTKIKEGLFRAVRDPLGIGKLFYTETSDGRLHFSERFVDLFPNKSPVYSVPAGVVVDIGTGGNRKLIQKLSIPQIIDESLSREAFETEGNPEVARFRKRFEDRLNTLFTMFRSFEADGWSFFIALSGGLDSTIIASKAAKYLKSSIACTLDLGKSEDSEKSQRIAKASGASAVGVYD